MASIAFYQATWVDRYRVIIALKVSKMPKGESTGSKPKPESLPNCVYLINKKIALMLVYVLCLCSVIKLMNDERW